MNVSTSSNGIDDRWEAFAALLVAISLQVLLTVLSETRGWEVWRLPGWVWLLLIGPELALLTILAVKEEPRETIALALGMGLVNAFALFALIASIVGSHEQSGGQLLLKGITVWTTNVTAFGIVFWQLAHWGRKRERRQFLGAQLHEEILGRRVHAGTLVFASASIGKPSAALSSAAIRDLPVPGGP